MKRECYGFNVLVIVIRFANPKGFDFDTLYL